MKKIILIAALAMTISLAGCSKDENNSELQQVNQLDSNEIEAKLDELQIDSEVPKSSPQVETAKIYSTKQYADLADAMNSMNLNNCQKLELKEHVEQCTNYIQQAQNDSDA